MSKESILKFLEGLQGPTKETLELIEKLKNEIAMESPKEE